MIHGFVGAGGGGFLISCLKYFLIPVKKEILLITVRIWWSDVAFLSSLACLHHAWLHTETLRPLLQLQKPALCQWAHPSVSLHFRDVKVASAHAGIHEAALLMRSTIHVCLAALDQ